MAHPVGRKNFYPRSPCGERHYEPVLHQSRKHFYPRSPCGERLGTLRTVSVRKTFLSTLSLRRATQLVTITDKKHGIISIHALLAESDHLGGYKKQLYYCISIHALLAESDDNGRSMGTATTLFLSTLSLRRATAKVHKTVGHFCAYETNFMEIASSC